MRYHRLEAEKLATLLLPLLILITSGSSLLAEKITISSCKIERLETRENLVPNFSFESFQPGAKLPNDWIWDKRNTDATCELDGKAAHSGKYSLKFTNNTPFGAHIYGTLWRAKPIQIIPGKLYTLSAYVLSSDPGVAWIGGGSNWQFRLPIPATGGKWKRIWMTFIPSEADRDFILRINTESPTKGFWVDDVKLEEGAEPTPCIVPPPEWEIQAIWSEVGQFFGDDNFSLPLLLYSPNEVSLQIIARLGFSPLFKKDITIPAGAVRLTLEGKASGVSGAQRLNLKLIKGGKNIMSSEFTVNFFSPSSEEARLRKIEKALPELGKTLDELKAKGEDVSYPMVSYTVLDNFLKYAKEDLAYYREKDDEWVLKRAIYAIDDMEKMVRRLNEEIGEAKAGKLHFPEVPRWTGNERAEIIGSSFIAPTKTPTGAIERRPVFFTGYGAFRQVRADIEKFPNYGANIVQIEFGPSSVFPREGEVSDAPIRDTLQILDRAKKAGVAVNLLISPHYFPDWMMEKYPHLQKKRIGAPGYCLHAPESKDLLLRYISVIIPPLKDHPALHSICLTNEPMNVEEPCEYAIRDWHSWLERKHGDISSLNARWGANYSSFEDIPLPNPFSPDFNLPTPLRMDYVLFNQEWFAGWHKMLADAVHEIAPDLPVHAKAGTWNFTNDSDVHVGVDAELFAEFSQINGNDSVDYYSHGQAEFAQGWIDSLMPYDLQISMKDMPIFNSENHLILDRERRYVPPEHIRCALWQEAIYGQGATTIWVWDRSYDPKSDFAGSLMERPLCAEAVGITNHDLNRLAEYVTSLQNSEPKVAIVIANSSRVWDRAPSSDCRNKLYTALTFCGVKVRFVSERQLERGEVPSTPILFVPNIHHLSDKAFQGLKRYQGKVVLVGEGELLNFNEYDKPREEKIDGERLAYRYASESGYAQTSAQDIWQELLKRLREWGIKPDVEVVDMSGKPVWGVTWLSNESEKGTIVNICNYGNDKVDVKLRGKEGTAIDLIAGKEISLNSIFLSPLEFRLLLIER